MFHALEPRQGLHFQAQLIETDEVDEVDHVHLRLNYPGQTFRIFAAQQP
jgi:hypothetical protein